MRKVFLFILIAFMYNAVDAQSDNITVKKDTVTDTTAKNLSKYPPQVIVDGEILKISPVKTLSYAQYDALLKGEDIYDMTLTAELNHYPMPDKVIKYKRELDLSPSQISKISAISTELHRKRVEMGGIIIKNEQTLDDLFKNRKLDEGSIIFYANRYGLYQGEMRTAILLACYRTEKLLSPGQIKRLEALENQK